MTKGMRLLVAAACIFMLTAGLGGPAYGFFPKGGYNFSQQLRLATWPFKEFDTNENGTVEAGEGLEFLIESGPRGFTNPEIEQVKAGFKVWEDVPTSYVAFRFVGNIEDPIIPGTIPGNPDADSLPMVFLQVNEVAEDDEYSLPDDTEYTIPGLSSFIPAITITTYAIDTAVIDVGGVQVIIPAGTILDCDIVVNASAHRAELVPDTTFGTLDLQATITHQVGQLLGLSYTPLNNLDPFNTVTLDGAGQGLPVEPALLQITAPDGEPRMLGATPTMFPIYFLSEMPSGAYVAGWRDLAPDDISGISWLYPREDGLENFFSIKQEARTHVRRTTGIPSAPVSGAHVVAWASISTDDTDTRVPLFSTITGFYEKHSNIQLAGRFNLLGLWKQMELPGRVNQKFEPSYVFTMNPLNGLGYDRQAPADFAAEDFDSLQGDLPISYTLYPRPADFFSSNYPSEVFNENGNIYGIDNNTAGTPLVWSFEKNTLVSKVSDKTLPEMLPTIEPMFGDPNEVCFFNFIENSGTGTEGETVLDGLEGLLSALGMDDGSSSSGGAGASGSGLFSRLNGHLRSFRDDVLLKSAYGTAIVDMYYRVAPYLVHQLLQHEFALRIMRGLVFAVASVLESGKMVVSLILFAGLGLLFMRLRNRMARITAAGLAVALLCVSGAFAGQPPLSDADLIAGSTYIITGEVTAAEGRMGLDNRIYTDVSVKVKDVVKGTVNADSTFSFSVIGGKYGNLVTTATGIPGFSKGDAALMYFEKTDVYGVIPYGGQRSKVSIVIEPETGEKQLISDGTSLPAEPVLETETAEKSEGAGDEQKDEEPAPSRRRLEPPKSSPTGFVPLSEYLQYLREMVNSQR